MFSMLKNNFLIESNNVPLTYPLNINNLNGEQKKNTLPRLYSVQCRIFWLFRLVDKKGQKQMKRMEKKWKKSTFYDANELWYELNTIDVVCRIQRFKSKIFEMALSNVLRHITIQPLYIMSHKIHWFICHVHIQSTFHIRYYLANSEWAESAESRIHCYYFWPFSRSIPNTEAELYDLLCSP